MKVSGCLAFAKTRNRHSSKFDPKFRKLVFLGYDSHSTAYLLQDIDTQKLTRARYVVFEQTKLLGSKHEVRRSEDDFLFDVSFDEENLETDLQIIVKTDTKDENLSETLVDNRNIESEDSFPG